MLKKNIRRSVLTFFLISAFAAFTAGCSEKSADEAPDVTETVSEYEEQAFSGTDDKYIEYGFSETVNRKDFNYQLFCFDGKGNIYFSDPDDGFKLYVYDGSESRRLTDIKAYGLNYYDNKIYFLSSEKNINIEDQVSPEGYPYEYDIESETLLPFGEREVCGLTVTGGEIYAKNQDDKCFFYKYDKNDPDCRNNKLFDSFSIIKIGDRFLTYETGSRMNFYLQNETDKQFFFADDIPLNCVFCYGKFYYLSQNTRELISIDMKSGERTVAYSGGAHDFTVMDGTLYVIKSDMFLYKITGADSAEKLNDLQQFSYLYTDNISLYGVMDSYNAAMRRTEYFFVKLNPDYTAEIINAKEDNDR